MTPTLRALLAVAWVAALAVLGVLVERRLEIGADLRLFMPAPRDAAQRLLLEQIGEGPGSRLLLIALGSAPPETLAASSQALAVALAQEPAFRRVANGAASLDDVPEELLAYRYLLSPTLDTQAFDAEWLRAEFAARAEDFASPAAGVLEEWLPRDPTLETLKLVEQWAPPAEPNKVLDVWFAPDGARALLVAETAAPGFDPDGQRAALDALERAFAASKTAPGVELVASGPGVFGADIKQRTQRDAQTLGTLATLGMLALLLVAYRSVPALLFGALPLASAGLAGLAAVSAAFGTVHGITLAFGFTLIGVAQDYPLHVLSHRRPGEPSLDTVRGLWPTLATGVASTCIAYLAFLFSGVAGLAQLAVFTIVGLGVAGLTTRYLLPRLLGPAPRDVAASTLLETWRARLARWPRPRGVVATLAALAVVVLVVAPGPMWENNLAALTPVPKALLDRDRELRAALGAPDVRHVLVLQGADADDVLARSEALQPALDGLVAAGTVAGYDAAARYLPSRATQERRRAALPDDATLRALLDDALADSPFERDAFAPFGADVARARTLAPLTVAGVEGTPLELRVGGLLFERDGRWTALVSFTGVADPAALAAFAAAHEDVMLLDVKAAAESLVVAYRERILASLAIAALLLTGVVAFALRRPARVRRVLAPMALTTLLIVATLHGAGVPLSLFHLIALVLAAGLGLDYALFFEHAGDAPDDERRTLHAVLVCAASTLLVFALLATSTLPVLRAIGITVTLGVVSNFVLALLSTRSSAA